MYKKYIKEKSRTNAMWPTQGLLAEFNRELGEVSPFFNELYVRCMSPASNDGAITRCTLSLEGQFVYYSFMKICQQLFTHK